jgi:hypothetical protein
MVVVFLIVREGIRRIFLMTLIAPPLIKTSLPGLSPDSLIADLPMNLLIIGADWSPPVASLLHRSDIQVVETEELVRPAAVGVSGEASTSFTNPADRIVSDGRPLLLHNFDCIVDDPELSLRANSALMRVMSRFENSIIIVAAIDPLARPSLEASDSWRFLLRSFVRMDLNAIPPQKVDEDDAEYEERVSANSYYRWVISGLSNPEKLVLLQLAQEDIVNPNSYHIVLGLMEQGLIERRHGLLSIRDRKFAEFMKRAIADHTAKHWETEIAGTRPFSLQTVLLVMGVGAVAFLVYTQGDVFNTWVTYATGVAASVPKALQLLDGLRGKAIAKT